MYKLLLAVILTLIFNSAYSMILNYDLKAYGLKSFGENNSAKYDNITNQLNEEIKNVYDKISSAFSEKDLEQVLSYFSDSKEMTKISNGKILRGKKELSEYFYKSIDKLEGLSISIENIELHIIDETHVWTIADEYISYNGQKYKAIVSNIFVKTESGWKILQDHTTYISSH